MKRMLYLLLPFIIQLSATSGFANRKFVPDITLTTSALAAADINQGTSNNILYVVQMSVATDPAIVNNIQFTLSGTHDANDLSAVLVYFNATAPTMAGAIFMNSVASNFAAPHLYSISISRSMAAGSTGYFIIAANIENAATDNNTIKVNGATNPVVFSFNGAATVTNNQSDIAGVQTIQAADITLSSSAVAAADINQGTSNNIIYIAQMSVATQPVVVNSIQFTLSGIHDANDLSAVLVYFNATAPTLAGATFMNSVASNFAAPHLYNIGISRSMAIGSSGYFIITANIENFATDNNTIKINGATNPVTFGYNTAPNQTNNQTDAAGMITIQAADITLSSSAVAAADTNQGTNNSIIYITQMSVATQPVVVNNIQFTLSGTHDANDLSAILVYFNATAPSLTGATFMNSVASNFAAPHLYNVGISRSMAIGSSGYFIITANIENFATDNNTIKINGSSNPVTFGYNTAPNHTNNQTDVAGPITIQAADITLVTSTVAAVDVNQGTNNSIIYITQMSVANQPVVVNNIQFTLSGTHDANDLSAVLVYFNATAPSLTGAIFMNSVVSNFAAPHLYNVGINRSMAIGSTGYFIITANIENFATDNNTIKINGATNPVTFGYNTAPNHANNQTDAAGMITIQAADITLVISAVAAADVNQGTNNSIIYITQMSVATQPVVVNNIQFTLGGTHDANDLSAVLVYFNATAPSLTGATFMNSVASNFAAPHLYNISINRSMAIGSTGYFIIAANIENFATDNNTIKINGATAPVTFGYNTAPNHTNNQTDAGGPITIQAADITLATTPLGAANITPGNSNHIVYIAQLNVATQPVVVNNIQFTLGGTHDADDLSAITIYFNAGAPTFSGAIFLNSVASNFAAPHLYNVSISRAMAAGSQGYFLILVNANPTATVGNTVHINGATNPVVFGFNTGPNITNNQSNAAGVQTLPVNLTEFTGVLFQKEVNLNWITASEFNNAFFEIEHGTDGITFKPLGRVAGNGTTTTSKHYIYIHDHPGFGANYYRLKQTDLDGNYRYSQIVVVFYNPGKFTITNTYPNPASNQIRYTVYSMENSQLIVEFIDAGGRVLINRKENLSSGINKMELNLSGFSSGIYQLRIVDVKSGVRELKQVVIGR